ncbi:extracellular solute-binding protein [Rubrobacter marinus]|uniref:Extracellular solute-binding protein n=1 Tax=Rubrobacter marinus TaxID=2653852 RepID=A0A6G8PVL8_9ACTN|nr:extracellular solute-binding protein [Rubrobacter marinus]QIN78250.1 extracellular solute-binding protein [Rubrobacter marinus]
MAERSEGTRGDTTSVGAPGFGGRGMNRRDFLKLAGAGLAGASLLGVAGCGGGGGGGEGGVQEFTFSFGPDSSGSLQALVDRFNQQFEGQYRANYREMPADTGQYFDQIRTEFQGGGGDIDLIGGDVIWPAQLAAPGYIADLSDRFPEEERANFLEGPIESNTFEGAVYGVPWFTDAGMLYRRVDLLEQAGFTEPPATWDELKEQVRAVQEQVPDAPRYGFVFQGSNYEGAVVNGLEYIYSAGGRVLAEGSSDEVVIDSPESAEGLSIERSMVEEGIAPQAVANFTETESQEAFLQGDAIFCRNWPYLYALTTDPEGSQITPEQVGVSALPAAEGGESVSGLGGWNFYLNANSENQDAAYEFVRFATSAEQQKQRALDGSFLPTLKELYEDQEILDAVPVIALAPEALERTQPRPISPYYSDMSLRMAEQFNNNLTGNQTPEETVATLQEQLTEIVQQAQ